MDILRVNFADVLPPSTQELRKQTSERTLDAVYLLKLENDSSNNSAVCNKKLFRDLLCNLRLIRKSLFENPSPEDFDALTYGLEEMKIRFEQIWDCDGLDNNERITILRRVRKELRGITTWMAIWESLESKYKQYELPYAGGRVSMPSDQMFFPGILLWNSWCSSRTQARDEGRMPTLARYHVIPNGGHYILEHWRAEVNGVLATILQVNESDAVKHLIGEATETFTASVPYVGVSEPFDPNAMKMTMYPVSTWGAIGFRDPPLQFFPERMSSNAHFLDELEGLRLRVAANTRTSLIMQTFVNQKEIQAAERNWRPYVRWAAGNW